MDRDEKIDLLANHLTETHQDSVLQREDNARLKDAVERLIREIQAGNKETYDIKLDLQTFTAEARLLINDRISEMSVERLAEVLTREKIDKVRALLYARERGVEPSPLMRDPTGSQPIPKIDPEAEDKRDPWYSRLGHAVLRQPLSFKITLVIAVLLGFAIYALSTEIKSNRRELRRQQTQEGKQ